MRFEAFSDSAEIRDDDVLWRAVSPRSAHPSDATQITGQFFQDYSDEAARDMGFPGPCMSVGIFRLLEASSGSPEPDFLKRFDETYGIVSILAGELRHLILPGMDPCPQGVMLAPEPDPWHAVVWNCGGCKRSKPASRAIARLARWVKPIT